MGQRKPFVVSYKDEYYDLAEFQHKHPGGINTLSGLENKDMADRFEKPPGHSSAALYLMKEYKIKAENDNLKTTDDSMEHLVDWNKAMVPQILLLGNNYAEWVNKPVDRPLRLFGPDYLEVLTKTPWWAVPAFWVPAILYLIRSGFSQITEKRSSSIHLYLNIVGGIILWTILEYSLHRWVFHLDPIGKSKYVHTFHFMLHGLHHKVPFDPYRLVFPPFPALILASIFYQPLHYTFNYPKLVLAGGLIGYLCYDMIHYYIHYGSPSGGHFYHMKRYHYQHHFAHHDKGFGISSQFWDEIFGTGIILRKLKYLLKW